MVTVHTTLLDVFPTLLRRGVRPTLLMIAICFICYLLGLTCTTRVSRVLGLTCTTKKSRVLVLT